MVLQAGSSRQARGNSQATNGIIWPFRPEWACHSGSHQSRCAGTDSVPDQPQVSPGPPRPLCDIPLGCGLFTRPWTVPRSSLRTLRRVTAFRRPLRRVLLVALFPRSRGPVVGAPGSCWWLRGVVLRWYGPVPSASRLSTTCLAAFPCA